MVVETGWPRGAQRELGERRRFRRGEPEKPAPAYDTVRQVPSERTAASGQVLVHGRSHRWAVVGRCVCVERIVGDLLVQVQSVAQHPELILGHLLDLVGGIARFDLGPERPALDGLREDCRRRPDVLGRRLVGGVELAVVVPAPGQGLQLLVGEVLHELAQARVRAEEVLADVGARLGGERLGVAVESRVHLVEQHAVDVTRQQLVPAPAPDDLDHVPSASPQQRLQLLDDLAVAPDRTVEALKVAVDDEGEVVQAFAGRQAERGPRLRLVELTVPDETPHP